MPIPPATHTYIATEDINGEPNSFTGLPVALLKNWGSRDHAGFDGEALVLAEPEELVRRFRATTWPELNDYSQLIEVCGSAEYPGMLTVGVWIEKDLEPLE